MWKISKPYVSVIQYVLIWEWLIRFTHIVYNSTLFSYNISLYTYIIIYFSILPSMDIWIVSGVDVMSNAAVFTIFSSVLKIFDSCTCILNNFSNLKIISFQFASFLLSDCGKQPIHLSIHSNLWGIETVSKRYFFLPFRNSSTFSSPQMES